MPSSRLSPTDTPPASIRGTCCTTWPCARMNSGATISPNFRRPASTAIRLWFKPALRTGTVTDTIRPERRADAAQHFRIRERTSAMSKTHFGFQSVDEQDKAQKVAGVFHSVASNYDLMNDLMSGGLHRAWKMFTIAQANVRPGFKGLDIAGGTGDLSKAFAKRAGATGEVWHTDINESMLRVGRDRLI